MPNLKTCFCYACNKFMECPYQSIADGELYHKLCLPESDPLGSIIDTIKELIEDTNDSPAES